MVNLDQKVNSSIATLFRDETDTFLSRLKDSDLEVIPFSPNVFHVYHFVKIDKTAAVVIDHDRALNQVYIHTVGLQTEEQQNRILNLLTQKTGIEFDYRTWQTKKLKNF